MDAAARTDDVEEPPHELTELDAEAAPAGGVGSEDAAFVTFSIPSETDPG